jgi:hypothetical protein
VLVQVFGIHKFAAFHPPIEMGGIPGGINKKPDG